MQTMDTSKMVRPYIYNIENSPIYFGLDLPTGFYWVADYAKRIVVSGDFESLLDAEGAAYEYLFDYAETELLNV
jgi:hypothetical protein